MKQKKISFTVLLLLAMGITTLRAQQSSNAAGGDATGAGGSASYSVGQPVYTYNTGTFGSSNQGVQQPYEFFITGIDENKDVSLSLAVFPNPTQAAVHLKVENQDLSGLSFEVYDVTGKLLLSQKISNTLTSVPMQTLASATYYLKVLNKQKAVKTFTLIKNN